MLSKYQDQILEHIFQNQQITDKDFETLFKVSIDNKKVKSLFSQRLLYVDSSRLYMPKIISLTEHGRAYVESLHQNKSKERQRIVHDWINTAISLFALITSIFALILSTKR